MVEEMVLQGFLDASSHIHLGISCTTRFIMTLQHDLVSHIDEIKTKYGSGTRISDLATF
jgi:hypothetical protein